MTSRRSLAARIARILVFVGVSVVLLTRVFAFAAQRPLTLPPADATPAAKDSYVEEQLATLFAGAPVRIAIHGFMNARFESNAQSESTSVGVSKAGSASTAEPGYILTLFDYHSDSIANRQVQGDIKSLKSPVLVSKPGYDEFYAAEEGRMIGRCGSLVVRVYLHAPVSADAALLALASNVRKDPSLFQTVVRYAAAMHLGDIAPARAALSRLITTVPELPTMAFGQAGRGYVPSDLWGRNSIEALYSDATGGRLMIIAKAYDSDASAKAGLEIDVHSVEAGYDVPKPPLIPGVKVYEYSHYGALRFQTGPYTFDFSTMNPVSYSLAQKAFVALAADLAKRSASTLGR